MMNMIKGRQQNHILSFSRHWFWCFGYLLVLLIYLKAKGAITDVVEQNKHKFMQKVAKKNILLISFEFSASISSVHKRGFTRLNEVKRY